MFDLQGSSKWLLTGFYGEPHSNKRKRTWSLLTNQKSRDNAPWMVIGDFNEILFHHEKWGGKQRTESLMQNFREFLEIGELYDLRYSGDIFTWSNHHNFDTFSKEQLEEP